VSKSGEGDRIFGFKLRSPSPQRSPQWGEGAQRHATVRHSRPISSFGYAPIVTENETAVNEGNSNGDEVRRRRFGGEAAKALKPHVKKKTKRERAG
jgi:hypothetical protein